MIGPYSGTNQMSRYCRLRLPVGMQKGLMSARKEARISTMRASSTCPDGSVTVPGFVMRPVTRPLVPSPSVRTAWSPPPAPQAWPLLTPTGLPRLEHSKVALPHGGSVPVM